jgi:hypothetical protein
MANSYQGMAGAKFTLTVWCDRDGKPTGQVSTQSTVRGLPLNVARACLEQAITSLQEEHRAMIWHHFPEERHLLPERKPG